MNKLILLPGTLLILLCGISSCTKDQRLANRLKNHYSYQLSSVLVDGEPITVDEYYYMRYGIKLYGSENGFHNTDAGLLRHGKCNLKKGKGCIAEVEFSFYVDHDVIQYTGILAYGTMYYSISEKGTKYTQSEIALVLDEGKMGGYDCNIQQVTCEYVYDIIELTKEAFIIERTDDQGRVIKITYR